MKLIRAVTVSASTCFYSDIVPDMKNHGYDVVSISSPGAELQLLRDKGARVIEVPMERHISPIKDIISLAHLIVILSQEKPDIVHSMTPKAGLLCMVASWICRVPIRIHTFTGLVWPTTSGLKRRVLMLTDKITCCCSTHIIPEGRGVMSDLQSYITKKPMKVLGFGNVRGVDMGQFSRRPKVEAIASNIRNNCFTFLYVGRIVADKGINELVFAFSKLHNKYPDTRLILIGRYEDELDPLRKETINLIKENIAIESVGQKSGDELIAFYAASDCFIFPSYREGFPNTVLEAGAMSLPCIVTDINGSREIIENGMNGLIIHPQNEEEIYCAMEKILTDIDLRQIMASNARRMIGNRYEQGFVRKCLFDYYDEILKTDGNLSK